MDKKKIFTLVFGKIKENIVQEKKDIFYLLYYSVLEAILFMITPLTSIFIVNSVLAHAEVSILSLSIIVITIFIILTFLQVIKKYMTEKFEQKIFVKNALEIGKFLVDEQGEQDKEKIDKYMNYFFDIISIQKVFPLLLLDGSALLIKVFVSMILLFVFDTSIFILALVFFVSFIVIAIYFGRNAPSIAVEKSNAKHEAIYYLQKIISDEGSPENRLEKLDKLLVTFVEKRHNMYTIIVKQIALTYITEGMILSLFFIYGGYLVYEGVIPVGEFVAIEIIIISITSTLKEFMKNLDYIYEIIEGFYKLDKITKVLGKSV